MHCARVGLLRSAAQRSCRGSNSERANRTYPGLSECRRLRSYIQAESDASVAAALWTPRRERRMVDGTVTTVWRREGASGWMAADQQRPSERVMSLEWRQRARTQGADIRSYTISRGCSRRYRYRARPGGLERRTVCGGELLPGRRVPSLTLCERLDGRGYTLKNMHNVGCRAAADAAGSKRRV